MTMREKILNIISLAKQVEYHERSAEWFDTGVNGNLRAAARTEEELEKEIEDFLLKYDVQTA